MVIQFRTEDESIFFADTVKGKWARIDQPATVANQGDIQLLEEGPLVNQGYGVYVMKGRTPETEGPGAKLSGFGIMPVVEGDVLDVYIRANVKVHEFTMPVPVNRINYKVIDQ